MLRHVQNCFLPIASLFIDKRKLLMKVMNEIFPGIDRVGTLKLVYKEEAYKIL